MFPAISIAVVRMNLAITGIAGASLLVDGDSTFQICPKARPSGSHLCDLDDSKESLTGLDGNTQQILYAPQLLVRPRCEVFVVLHKIVLIVRAALMYPKIVFPALLLRQ